MRSLKQSKNKFREGIRYFSIIFCPWKRSDSIELNFLLIRNDFPELIFQIIPHLHITNKSGLFDYSYIFLYIFLFNKQNKSHSSCLHCAPRMIILATVLKTAAILSHFIVYAPSLHILRLHRCNVSSDCRRCKSIDRTS